MAYPPPSFRQRIPGRPMDGGGRFTPRGLLPRLFLAADDRTHRRLDRVGGRAPAVIMPRAAAKPDRRRALKLLAASPDGYTEALMLAHGFPVRLLVDLCIAGLAVATPERMVAGGRPVEVVRVKITEEGRRARAEAMR
jgi:hypothetical protein